jgi:hypothetical protein
VKPELNRDLIDSIALASIYRLQAVNFRLSAEQLADTMEKKADGSPAKLTAIPIYFLVSHAVELFLKSALLKRGFTKKYLRKYDYRHNLNSLLEALQEKGVLVTSDAIGMINGLHSQHQTHALRYNVITNPYMPPPSLVFSVLDELLLLTAISTQGV